MKEYIPIILITTALIILGGLWERGYLSVGAEVILLIICVSYLAVWRFEK